jgi:6-phosphogluconolactonase (cycloisomerase 2 family)
MRYYGLSVLIFPKTGMVELASNRVFEASDPVESIAFDATKSHLAVTSHHGRISLYNLGRNGELTRCRSEAVQLH